MRKVLYHTGDGQPPKEYVVLAENPPTKDSTGNDIPGTGTLDLGTVEANHDKSLAEGSIREGVVRDPKGAVIPASTVLVDGKRTTLVIGKCPVSADGRPGTCTDPEAKFDPKAPAPVELPRGQHWAKSEQGRADAQLAAQQAAAHQADVVAAGVAHRAAQAKEAPAPTKHATKTHSDDKK